MFYKFLGYLVWQGAKFELRRRYGNKPQKVLAGTVVAGVLTAGVVAAIRQQQSD
jgi:RsiW-degrading membrane proteinase PrsW (M82 family)